MWILELKTLFCYEEKHLNYKINLLTFSFSSATSDISLIQKSNNILDSRIVTRYYFTSSMIECNSLTKINFSISLVLDLFLGTSSNLLPITYSVIRAVFN